MNLLTTIQPRSSRRAVSKLEVVGCLLAVVVGVWLGSRLLGLDLHSAAYVALADSKVIDKLPEEWRPEPPAGLEPLPPAELKLALRKELDEIHHDVALLYGKESQEAEASYAIAVAPELGSHPDLAARRQRTLAFWSELGGVRAEVNKLQQSADEAVSKDNLYKVLEIRQRAYAYGAKAVEAAMNEGVDAQALQFAEQLVLWYENGANLYGQAMNVWQGQRLAPEGLANDELLAQVRQQHDNEALLLFQKSDRLCEVLVRRYQVAFPEIEDLTSSN